MTKVRLISFLAIVMLVLSCAFLSCSRGTPPAGVDVDLGEVGAWTWVMSHGGIAGITIYADSVDFTRQLVFDSDSNYVYTRDGEIESAGMYIRSFETLPGGTGPVWVVRYSDNMLPADVIGRLDADTLVLSQTAADGFTSTYAR
ncbi:MAG: hypothetical protein OEV49_14140 [candidate division Zixibacteria bacterium]|nr:hypothetical protein [candidate division Zixibacteria bacterium]MDH3937505.1 hypothetical protein [candidate division Zixibacteria bacterium]MDH4033663.1 hypothetical protein [candidate division Zixibacteria bacterium]